MWRVTTIVLAARRLTGTSRHGGYQVSQRSRKRVEEPFGWDKTVGLIRQLKVRGLPKVNGVFMMTMIGWNLTRMRSLQG
jgi:hypothetical protein